MKNLPNVTSFSDDKEFRNYQERYYGNTEEIRGQTKDINKKINDIFASKNHVYKSRVIIYTKDSVFEKEIIGRTSTQLITKDGKKIRIIDILDIEKVNS